MMDTEETQNEINPGQASPQVPHYRLMSMGSGSSGNSYYLEHNGTCLLIDAGIAPRTIRNSLAQHRIDMNRIEGILVTHDHADHVRAIGVIATQYQIPIYATAIVCQALIDSRYIVEDLRMLVRPIPVGVPLRIGSMEITSFEVPHDSSQNVGYSIASAAGTFTLITDIGHITDDIRLAVRRSNYLIFESNYDRSMLISGRYPRFLKERIMSPVGHISNQEAADTIAENYQLGLTFLALCHLSKDNNHPDLAWKTMENRLALEGIRVGKDLNLYTLKRTTASPFFILSPH